MFYFSVLNLRLSESFWAVHHEPPLGPSNGRSPPLAEDCAFLRPYCTEYRLDVLLPLSRYPYMTENVMLEVSDEIAAALSMGGRLCDSYKRQKRRNGECSLDTDPGFEADVLRQPMTPDEYIEARETTFALYDAMAQLPPTQARRVYQHYLLGMSKAEIAAAEGVGRSRICCSVERGLAAMKNILKKSL